MIETRHFESCSVPVLVRIKMLLSRRKNRIVFLKASNLSTTGAFFPEWKYITFGRPIKVQFYLPFESQNAVGTTYEVVVTTVTGKVVRSDQFGTAVSFADDYQMKTYRCPLLDTIWQIDVEQLVGEIATAVQALFIVS